jgi:hypothetical protein
MSNFLPQKGLTCAFECRPFQPCGKPATFREFTFGTPLCTNHAIMKERLFDLKVVRIEKIRKPKT